MCYIVYKPIFKMCRKNSIPFKYIVLSSLFVLFFILYWIVLCPFIWYKFNTLYIKHYQKSWPILWPVYYWLTALFIFILILMIGICLWQYHKISQVKKQSYKSVEDAPGYQIVLGDTFKKENFTNNTADHNRELSKICCDYKTVVQQPKQDVELYNQRALKNQSLLVSAHDVSPTQESKQVKEKKQVDECDPSKRAKPILKPLTIPKQENVELKQISPSQDPKSDIKSDESVQMRKTPKKQIEIDTEMFLKNERYMMDIENTRSSLTKERFNDYLHLVEITTPFSPDTHIEHFQQKSPLTPREIFFKDLMDFENRPAGQRTSACYPTRAIPWSNDFNRRATLSSFKSVDREEVVKFDPKKVCTLPSNPEKIKSDENRKRTSSSEYFIANVPEKKSITSEAFLFVSGEGAAQQITKNFEIDVDDNVFSSQENKKK